MGAASRSTLGYLLDTATTEPRPVATAQIRRLRDQLQRDVDACQAQLGGASPGG